MRLILVLFTTIHVRKEVEEGRIGRGHCISNYSSAAPLCLNGTENQSVIRGCVKMRCFFFLLKINWNFLSRKIFVCKMETLVKVNSSRGGRDKVFRTLQYCLKAINSRPYLATNETRNLEKTLASFRKLLRLGTFIDVLHGARQSMHHHSSLLTGAILTLSKIANAMYLFGDHLIWIHRSEFLFERKKILAKIKGFFGESFRNNLIKVKDIKEWEKFSNQSWLYSIILNLMRDYFELKVNRTSAAVVLDTVKNCADFWIPMSALGHVKVSPFFVGVMGVTSSLLSTLPLVDPLKYKF